MSKGYTQVHALLGGWNAWVNSGGATEPVAEAAPAPAPPPTPTQTPTPVAAKQPAATITQRKTMTRRTTRRTRPRSKRPATGH